MVPPDTPIVTFVAGDKSELKPGREDHHLRRGEEGNGTLEADPRQCRPRRRHAADVRPRLSYLLLRLPEKVALAVYGRFTTPSVPPFDLDDAAAVSASSMASGR